MKKKRFAVEQIVAILKQAELGIPIADVAFATESPSSDSLLESFPSHAGFNEPLGRPRFRRPST